MYKHKFENKITLLAKIYGMYSVKNLNNISDTSYYIAMENLFNGMPTNPD